MRTKYNINIDLIMLDACNVNKIEKREKYIRVEKTGKKLVELME